MKNKLLALYQNNQKRFKEVIEKYPDAGFEGPLLLSPNEKYCNQPTKLLIIGQQTYGWESDVDNMQDQMIASENFNLGEDYYSSPFWNITRKLEVALNIEPYSCAWTNLNKFDLRGGQPYGEYQDAVSKLDDILLSEIDIIKPDVCMFYTGPNFDYKLEAIYNDIEFVELPNFGIRQFCKLKHPNLPVNSYRSYHPKSLRINKLEEGFIEYFKNEFK